MTDAPCVAVLRRALEPNQRRGIVYTIDVHSIPDQPFGRETFARRDDAETFLYELRRSDPGLANSLRIEERELGAALRDVA
jgi:hypothetical protein